MLSRKTIITLLVITWATNTLHTNCRERNRPIDTEMGDLYILIDATLGQKITLQCHYCNENDDGRPKIWYKMDHLGVSGAHEVNLDMLNNNSLNRVHVNSEHSLFINNFTENDTGLYYCKRLEAENEEQEKFNYLVDVIFENTTALTFETGDSTRWKEYCEEYFTPINNLLTHSEGKEFRYARKELLIIMEVITQWKSWGPCDVCGRPNNEGISKKKGLCRIKLTHPKENNVTVHQSEDVGFLLNANKIACKSKVLGRVLPGISNLTKVIPDFVQVQPCEGTCNPDAEGAGRGWKAGKSSSFKYRKTFVLAENSHLTVICPESTMDNVVVWKRNGKVIKPGTSVKPPNPKDQPRIMVDTFNTLYFIDVRESEEGNYTCQVDDIRMEQVVVFIISKAKLLTQAFVRHMMYLGFILSLTLPCYFAGLVITCHRRKRFKNYQELKESEAERRLGYGF